MKLVKPSWEIWEQKPGIQGIYEAIERAGRVCYKSSPKYRWYSEDKTRWINEGTEDWEHLKNDYPIKGENISAMPFVEKMIKSGHGAMLEHGTVYLHIKDYYNSEASKTIAHYTGTGTILSNNFSVKERWSNPYSKCNIMGLGLHGRQAYITTNYRVLVENGWLDDLKYLCEPTEHHEKRITAHFILPIGISREFCRHRVFSFAEQSTRYCNFSADKFNNELTFIEDQWCDEELLRQIEYWYINSYLKPQEKRNMLPLCTKTELVMTGFVSDWEHFFGLRTPANAHPQARELAILLSEEFVKRGLIIK